MRKKLRKSLIALFSFSMLFACLPFTSSLITPIAIKADTKEELTDLLNLKGKNITGSKGSYTLANTKGNNHALSETKALAFTYEATIEFKGGDQCASLIFGSSSTDYNKLGAFFGLELSKNNDNLNLKLFQDLGNYGEGPKHENVVTNVAGNSFKLKLEVDDKKDLKIYIDGTLIDFPLNDRLESFKNNYIGGYLGMLTWNTEASFTDIKVVKEKDIVDNFNTTLSNLSGLQGTWQRMEDGLYSSGTSDNFALSTTEASNFIYEADIKFNEQKGAASLVFRSTDNPALGSYVANIDKSQNRIRIFRFPGGIDIGSAPLTESKDSYHLRVEAFNDSIKFYVDDELVVAGNDNTLKSGKLGLLTFNSSITYQNVKHTILQNEDFPVLDDFALSGDNVIFTPKYNKDVVAYDAFLPAGTPSFDLKASFKQDVDVSYILKSSGVQVDAGKLNSEISKTISPALGKNTLLINIKKGKTSTSFLVNIIKKSDAETMANEDYRPQLHFSPEINFMNDPNGLVYDPSNNTYHMFFQYSPQVNHMGSQTWGHAVSNDLVNWVELPVAIPMDHLGAIFSGSCVVDEKNTSGFFTDNKEGESKLVAMFTHAGKVQQQSIAYSKDHGVTWTTYQGNPVINNEQHTYGNDFRDPKVFKIDGDDRWYMVVAGGRGRLFASENLIDWTHIQDFVWPNGDELHSECPDLYQLDVLDEAGKPTGKTKWVYNGSSEFYVIGDMVKQEDGYYHFITETNAVASPTAGASKAYAAQSYYNDGSGKNRRLSVHWFQDYSTTQGLNTKRWNGVQSFPLETTLKMIDGNYNIVQQPASEVLSLRDKPLYEGNNIKVNPKSDNILSNVTGQYYDLEAIITLEDATEFGFELRTGTSEKTVLKYDVEKQKMILDKSQSGIAENSILEWKLKPMANGKIKLRAVVDNSVIETFGNDGDATLIDLCFPKPESTGMSFYTKDGSVTIDSIKVYDMKSIYTHKNSSESTKDIKLSLTSPEYAEKGEQFTVSANIYPMNSKVSEIKWIVDDKLEIIKKEKNAITLIATENGTFDIKANINNNELNSTVKVVTSIFNTDLIDWTVINGVWNATEKGLYGKNSGLGDSFIVSDTYLPKDKAFSYQGALDIADGTAGGLVFGINDPKNPALSWYCLNVDLGSNVSKLFKNTGNQNWSEEYKLSNEEQKNKSYHLRVEYDGKGNFTFFVNGEKRGSRYEPDYQGGYFGLVTFRSNSYFDHVYLSTDGTIETIESVKDIEVVEGTSKNELLAMLPKTLQGIQNDGIKRNLDVYWSIDNVDLNKAGEYQIIGEISEELPTLTVKVIVKPKSSEPIDPTVPVDPTVPDNPDLNESTTPETGDTTNTALLYTMLIGSLLFMIKKHTQKQR